MTDAHGNDLEVGDMVRLCPALARRPQYSDVGAGTVKEQRRGLDAPDLPRHLREMGGIARVRFDSGRIIDVSCNGLVKFVPDEAPSRSFAEVMRRVEAWAR